MRLLVFGTTFSSTLSVLIVALTLVFGCDKRDDQLNPPTLHHGQPGVRPFWNEYAGRFIYAPAFDAVDSTQDESSYGVVGFRMGVTVSSSLEYPWSPLSRVWDGIPFGPVNLTIERRSPDGVVSPLRTVRTIKSPGFVPQLDSRRLDPDSAGMAGLTAVLGLNKVQHWIKPGGPDPNYQLWVHPSKLMGVLSQGMLFLSHHSDDEVIRTRAREIATSVGEFLLGLREGSGTPLAGWTHSYWDGVDRGEHPIYMDQIMTQYPAEAAMAFLDLFDETEDVKWWNAAIATANTYANVQRPDGTWYLLQLRETGEPANQKLLVPVSVILFLDRLANQYEVTDYRTVRESAFEWIMANPVRTYAWEAQFEDTRPKSRYRNLSHREAANFATLLFSTSDDPEMIRLAEELLLFVEDQFLVWTHDDAVTKKDWFKEGSKWNGNADSGGKDWFLPAALEQYAFYTPIAGTTSNVIHAYCAAFDATGREDFRMRAVALSRSLMDAQLFHGSGEIPTHLRKSLPEENWLNNSVYAAMTLMDASCL